MKKLLVVLLGMAMGSVIVAQETIVNGLQHIPKGKQTLIFDRVAVFPENTQLAIATIENGEVDYYGVLRRNDTLVSIANQDSIFEIGSVTKVFAGTLLANCVLKGTIRLDDTVNDWFDFPFKNNQPIRFVSLANHSSGMPRLPSNLAAGTPNPYVNYDTAQLNAYLKNDLLLSENKAYAYSNLGTGLLGYALWRVTGQPPQALMESEIFSPLRMHHSFTNRQDVKKGLVKGLNPAGQPAPGWDFDVLFAAGGALSSVADLSRFVAAHFDTEHEVLRLTRTSTLRVNDKLQVGLGWHIVQTGKGDVYWHNGGTAGYTSSVAFDPSRKSGVIILSNVSAFHPAGSNIDELCFELLKHMP